MSGIFILADSRVPASWAQGERLLRAARRERRSALLRDYAEFEIALAFVEQGGDPARSEAFRAALVRSVTLLQFRFRLGTVACVPPVPAAMEAFLRRSGFPFAVPRVAPTEEERTPPPPGGPAPVLVIVNDAIPFSSKTSEALAWGARELGLRCRVCDISKFRLLAGMEEGREPDRLGGPPGDAMRGEVQRLQSGSEGAGPVDVLALDLHWFLDPDRFLDDPGVGRIFSFWYDDVKSWCQGSPNRCFPGAIDRLQESIRHPKVVHCCYGAGQLGEMRRLGLPNVQLSYLAAPSSYLEWDAPPAVTGRAAFIGNPGMRFPPPLSMIALFERGAELEEVRSHAREVALRNGLAYFAEVAAREPSVAHWLALALSFRAGEPHAEALGLLHRAGREYPAALEAVNATGLILDAAFFVKMANQFDRPALVHRMYRAGLADVYSNADEWRPYGIAAREDVAFPDLPAAYQRYAVHLNGYNALRNATANEKLFEIAACGRLSLNLASPDVAACYGEGEVVCVPTLAEAEERLRHFLGHPDEALARGAAARRRTAREHLWRHRLEALLGREDPGLSGGVTPLPILRKSL